MLDRGLIIKSDSKKRYKLLFKIAITIAILFYLVNYISYEEILLAIKRANKYYLFVVFLLMFLNIYLQFLKWRVVCNSLLKVNDDVKIWKSLFYGFSAGIVTPVRVGEYLGRKLAIEEVSLLRITISTIIEKFASLFIVLFVGGITSAFFIYSYYSPIYAFPLLLFPLGIIVLVSLIYKGYNFSSNTVSNLAEKFEFFKNIKLELSYVREVGHESVKKLLNYSFIFYIVLILQYALLAKAFDQTGDIFLFLVSGTIVMFVKSIFSFLSFADLGIRESTSVFLIDKMGYSQAVGFNSAIFLFLFNLLIPALIGLFLLLKHEKSVAVKPNSLEN